MSSSDQLPVIRIPSESDIDRLAALRGSYAEEMKGVSAVGDPGFEARFADWYRTTTAVSRWRVADAGSELVGLVHMFTHTRMPMPTYDAGAWGYISLLYVRPEHRGLGIGAQLLDAVEQDARDLGFSKVLLNPTEKAIALYRRCGYQPAQSYLVHTLDQ